MILIAFQWILLLFLLFFQIIEKLANLSTRKILILKALLVSILTIVALLSLPILLDKGNTQFKHSLEWNYFVGVILFYLLTRLLWKRTT